MKNYPILKTSLPFLQLQPLQKKHLPFLVELLSNKEIQATLFRIPTKISIEKQEKNLEKMYEGDLPKEITYMLSIKKLFSEKYLGYVKIKLIDWDVKSCYLSVAISPNKEYRGKGFAKAAYESFFAYLFSLGFMKIYGRTYENNIATIKLNEATGFKFIGRQSDFILYPNSTSLDALLFEKLNPALSRNFSKVFQSDLQRLQDTLTPLVKKRLEGTTSIKDLEMTMENLKQLPEGELLQPLIQFKKEIISSLESEIAEKDVFNSKDDHLPILDTIREIRAMNANYSGITLLAYPITREQFLYEKELLNQGQHLNDGSLLYGAYTPINWDYLRFLFLGKNQTTVNTIINTNQTASKNIQ